MKTSRHARWERIGHDRENRPATNSARAPRWIETIRGRRKGATGESSLRRWWGMVPMVMAFSLIATFGIHVGFASAGCIQGDCTNGFGVYQWDNGERYQGNFENGAFNGYGTYSWPNGAQYAGQWANNVKAGYGTYSWPDGKTYAGGWENNEKSGYGTFSWPDGKHFAGEFKANQRNGFGKYTWPDGASYEGQWKDGSKNGMGIYTFPDGTQKAGTWANDQLETPSDPKELTPILAMDQERVAKLAKDTEAHLLAIRSAASAPAAKTTTASAVPPPTKTPPSPKAAVPPPGPIASSPPAVSRPSDETVSAVFELAVRSIPVAPDGTFKPITNATLYTYGDHQPAGKFSLAIRPVNPDQGKIAVQLTVANTSACQLRFTGFLQNDDTYHRVASWTGKDVIDAGDAQTFSGDLTIEPDFSPSDLRFKAQGWGADCK